MKKISYLLSMMLCVAMVSCSEDDEARNNQQTQEALQTSADDAAAWSALNTSVGRLNTTYGLGNETRGGADKTKDVLKTDAQVALAVFLKTWNVKVAGLAGGLASAIRAFSDEQVVDKGVVEFDKEIPEAVLQDVIPKSQKQISATDSIGYMHNLLIRSSYNSHPQKMFTAYLFSDSIVNEFCGIYANQTGLLQSDLYEAFSQSSQAQTILSTVKSTCLSDHTASAVYDALLALPDADVNSLNLVSSIADTLAGMDDDESTEYVDELYDKINKSDLITSKKVALILSVTVAKASNKLWCNYYGINVH